MQCRRHHIPIWSTSTFLYTWKTLDDDEFVESLDSGTWARHYFWSECLWLNMRQCLISWMSDRIRRYAVMDVRKIWGNFCRYYKRNCRFECQTGDGARPSGAMGFDCNGNVSLKVLTVGLHVPLWICGKCSVCWTQDWSELLSRNVLAYFGSTGNSLSQSCNLHLDSVDNNIPFTSSRTYVFHLVPCHCLIMRLIENTLLFRRRKYFLYFPID